MESLRQQAEEHLLCREGLVPRLVGSLFVLVRGREYGCRNPTL